MPKILQLRLFQRQFEEMVEDIRKGVESPRDLYLSVTPGAGKSSAPLILSRLIPSVADKICWVAPRVELARQGEKVCIDPDLQCLLRHNASFQKSDNSADPTRNGNGYVTTYQAILSNPELHSKEFDLHRYILFLDEPHHVRTSFANPGDPSLAWENALRPLVDRAVMCVFASGTLERHDGKPIAFLPYAPAEDGGAWVVLPAGQTVTYSRRVALHEKAIVRLYFEVLDGKASWINKDGEPVTHETFDNAKTDGGEMLDAVLATEFASQLLTKTIQDWRSHKQSFPPAKLLVVSPNILAAKRYTEWMRREHGLSARIATSEDSVSAREAIQAFKEDKDHRKIDVLVTVHMAYEGLDVPTITHVACLARFRSKPWLEQCFARACRTYSDETQGLVKQGGYIYAPDDLLLRQVIDAIKADQRTIVHEQEKDWPPPPPPPPSEWSPIVPQGSASTNARAFDLEQGLTREETLHWAGLMQQCGIVGVSPLQIKRLMEHSERAAITPQVDRKPESIALTPSEQEARLRDAIDQYTKKVDSIYFVNEWGRANLEIRKQGFPPREILSIEQLRQLWIFLNQHYPLTPMGNDTIREGW